MTVPSDPQTGPHKAGPEGSPATGASPSASAPTVSPTRLALALGAGLLAVIIVLSWLAPPEGVVDLEQLARLVEADLVERVEVGPEGLVAHLSGPAALDDGGGRRRVDTVILSGVPTEPVHQALAAWRAAGLPVSETTAPPPTRVPSEVWVALVLVLLALGLTHLWVQARRYRREGSPRLRLQEARADLEAGRITPEEYERRASNLSLEM